MKTQPPLAPICFLIRSWLEINFRVLPSNQLVVLDPTVGTLIWKFTTDQVIAKLG